MLFELLCALLLINWRLGYNSFIILRFEVCSPFLRKIDAPKYNTVNWLIWLFQLQKLLAARVRGVDPALTASNRHLTFNPERLSEYPHSRLPFTDTSMIMSLSPI